MEHFTYTPGIPLSEAAGLALIEHYFQSGLSPKTFYTSIGMGEKTFRKWLRHYTSLHSPQDDRPSPEPSPCQLLPIHLLDTPVQRVCRGVELHYPNGVTLSLPADMGIDTAQLEQLLKIRV